MESGLKDRLTIFKIFSENLEEIKSHPEIQFDPDFSEGYICPLCFEVFKKSDVRKESQNQLTLEDVPPRSLGGKPRLLTCKKCNSKSGYILDSQLMKRLEEMDAREYLPNLKYKTKFESSTGIMNGLIEIDKDGKWIINLKNDWSDPKKANLFFKEVFPPRVFYNPLFNFDEQFESYKTNTFSIKFPQTSDERKAEIDLLKIGYLLAFSILGYSFLINPALFKVREQILNPDKQIFPSIYWINFNFPENLLGINIIKSPKELRCFLIIFDLKTRSKKRRFAIALPGPSDPGIKIYENIERILCNDSDSQNFKIDLEHINDIDFVKQTKNAWGASWFWQKYCFEI